MASPTSADDPFVLAVLLCAAGGLLGPAIHGRFRLAASLTTFTFVAVVLCQYKGCCGNTGSTEYYLARTISVSHKLQVQ